jgi:carnitine-CoA ligase
MDLNKTVPALIAQRAAENPERIFIQEVGGRAVTYAAFHTEALKWAALFAELDVREGATVLTMLSPSVDAYAIWMGLSWVRAIEVPCNTDYQERMLAYLCSNSGARIAIVAKQWAPRFKQIASQLPGLVTVIVPDADEPIDLPWRTLTRGDAMLTRKPAEDLNPPMVWDTCLMVYTSGTTGPSKGVLISWGQMNENSVGSVPEDDLSEDDAFYSTFPLFHGSGRMPLALMALSNGRLVIREKFNTDRFWEDVREYGCTTTALVGAMVQFLLLREPKENDHDNPLRQGVMLPLHPKWREFEKRFGIRVRTAYAMTECSPPIGTGWDISNPLSCGTLRPGYEARIVDAHDFEVPPGEIGELIVRHKEPWKLFLGYFGMPDKTVESWRNGWLHTGDAFRRDAEGNYYFVDRFKDAIRRRGENISSFEVELHVNAHPEVQESAAVAVPSEWGEDEVKVVVVRKPDSELKPEVLVQFLARTMPKFMVPRYVEFVGSLPKTDATMRVRKVELRVNPINENTWDRDIVRSER